MKLSEVKKLIIGLLITVVAVGLIFGLGGNLREIVSAQGINTVVFTGQVIPAYEGAAYDPTIAYQYLSGLPIYVFVYDNWRPGGGDDWVVNNMVVRTQIRADGTFQVMGLPHGANFGVYFPYQEICYDGANYSGNSVECWGSPATRRVERVDGLSTPPQVAPFRSPWVKRTGRTDASGALSVAGQEYGDGIADVFSYGFLECSIDSVGGNAEDCHSLVIYDQYGQEVTINEEFVFITSTSRLDVQSHINVFPLVPETVINLAIKSCDPLGGVSPCISEGNIDLYAERVVRRATPREYTLFAEDDTYTGCDAGYSCEAEGEILYSSPTGGALLASDRTNESCSFEGVCTELFVPASPTVIRGRTTRIIEVLGGAAHKGYFRAFAPPGLYSLNAWLTGEGISYQAYKINGPLGTNYYTSTFVLVDNSTDSHWNHEWASYGTGVRAGVHLGQARTDLSFENSVVWGLVLEDREVQGFPGRKRLLSQGEIETYYETAAAAGDFHYQAVRDNGANQGITNQYGINKVFSYANSSPHGLRVGVSDPDYLQSEDAVFVNDYSGPRRTQDFILRGPATTGYQIYVGIGGARGVNGGANGVVVSTLCRSCPFTRGSKQDLSVYRGRTGYEGQLTKDRSGYFYLPAGWFKENDDYAVTFSTSLLTAVCQLDRTAVNAMKGYSGTQPLDMISDCSAFPTGSSGTVTFTDGSSATGIVLQERPSTLVGFLPNLHIPNAFAQEVNVRCGTSSTVYCETEDPAAGCPCADCIVLPGTYGGGGGENYSGWDPTIIASVTGETCRAMATAGSELDPSYAQTLAEASVALSGVSLEVYDALAKCSFGKIEENVEEQSFTWQIPCGDLGAVGDDLTVRVSASLQESQGTGMAVGEVDVDIMAVTTGGVLSGYEFSHLSPNILIQPECPRAENLIFKGAEAVESWGPHYMCVITKGIASLTPKIFGWLERTMLHTEALTESPAVVAIWNHMRNVANVFTLITLLVIGFMTIFRVNPREFQPGAALGALLVSLVLINFSLLLCEVFIDLSNALVVYVFDIFEGVVKELAEQGLTTGGGSGAFVAVGGMGAALGGALISVLAASVAATGGISAGGIGAGLAVGAVCIATALMGILIAFLILYMLRYGVIWLCVIIAPLVFFLNNIPMFKGEIRKTWFKMFIGFTFIQTMAAIIIGVGMALLLGLQPELGIWQSFRQLLIAIAVLYLGTKSPSTILGMFGLDMATGKMVGQVTKMAEPLAEKVGGIKKTWGTVEGMGERVAERAQMLAHWRAEGRTGVGLGARRVLSFVPGLAGLQMAGIGAAQKDLKARDAGQKSGAGVMWKKANVATWKAQPLLKAYANVPDAAQLRNKDKKLVMGGVTMGDLKEATEDGTDFVTSFGRSEPEGRRAKFAHRKVVRNRMNAVMDAMAARKLRAEGKSEATLRGRARLRVLKRAQRAQLIQQYGGIEDPREAARQYRLHGLEYSMLDAAYKDVGATVLRRGGLSEYRAEQVQGGGQGEPGVAGGAGQEPKLKVRTVS